MRTGTPIWVLAGGSGLIGSRLKQLLKEQEAEVRILARNPKPDEFFWNPEKAEMDESVLENADVVVNLAGASVMQGRWTQKRKNILINSRLKPAEFLLNKIREKQVSCFYMQASAAGYYGNNQTRKYKTENNKSGNDFLAILCREWEKCVQLYPEIPACILRFGIVLDPISGALPLMQMHVKWYMPSVQGSGRQGMSWIHIQDTVNAILFLASNRITGPVNLSAPNPVSNRNFMRLLSQKMHRPFIPFHVPVFMLKLLMGELADMITGGQYLIPQKLTEAGYRFLFPELGKALENLLTLQK